MAERSTARSADGATHDHDGSTGGLDSWISRQSRLAARDDDPYRERREAAAPRWFEEPPEQHHPAQADQQQGRHAGHRHDDEHQGYDGTHGRHEPAYGWSDLVAYPEPDGHHPDAHDGRTDQRDTGSGVADPGPAGRPRHSREPEVRPRGATRRQRWLVPVGGLTGALLCTLALLWGSGAVLSGSGGPPEGERPVSAAITPLNPSEEPAGLPEIPSAPRESAAPASPSASASATPSATPSVTPSATPSVTPSASGAPTPTPSATTPSHTESPEPELLGPSSNRGVTTMVQRYCDRYRGGSADSRSDGRWQCKRFLSASIVDMNVACRDTYGSDAYAQNSDAGDAYAWRCYR